MEEEFASRAEIENGINACRQLLAQTDYQCLKYAEGALTEEEFAETKERRRQWREEINRLEAELAEAAS